MYRICFIVFLLSLVPVPVSWAEPVMQQSQDVEAVTSSGKEVLWETESWPGGAIKSRTPYVKGKKNGLATVYGVGGEILSEEKWRNDALVWRKEYAYFDLADGGKKIRSMQTYNNAHQLDGKSKFWRRPDVREKVLNYANGRLNSYCQFYDENGKFLRQEKWSNGRKLSIAEQHRQKVKMPRIMH
jgi:antitoxin component YwqK of YwqJK toxin-antitoxin module